MKHRKKSLEGTFFIASLPRCRTAWLANFLTTGNSFCYHEAMKFCPTTRDLKPLFESRAVPYVGDSDSLLPFFIDEVLEIFPNAKLVVIERDPEKVIKSLQRVFPEAADVPEAVLKTHRALEEMKKKYEPKTFQFEALGKEEVCKEIWSYCLPKIPFDEVRWKVLDHMVVEIHPKKYLQHVRELPPEAGLRIFDTIRKYPFS